MIDSREELKQAIQEQPDRIPGHVAIIMDGNGRWAAQRHRRRTYGHEAGVKAVQKVVRAAGEIGINFLTLYTFSIENWKRPADEVAALMSLLARSTEEHLDELMENDVRLITIGRTNGLSAARRRVLSKAIEKTSHNQGLVLNLALNYGGRTEIIDAVRAIAESVRAGRTKPGQIDESLMASYLYTAGLPDPDLLIRTSGEQRLSNFLLWQTSYTELLTVDTLWPDFGRAELYRAILDYQSRERRFGCVTTEESR